MQRFIPRLVFVCHVDDRRARRVAMLVKEIRAIRLKILRQSHLYANADRNSPRHVAILGENYEKSLRSPGVGGASSQPRTLLLIIPC